MLGVPDTVQDLCLDFDMVTGLLNFQALTFLLILGCLRFLLGFSQLDHNS